MNQIHGVLPLPICIQGMASTNVKLHHHLYRIRSCYLIYALMYFISHFIAILFLRNFCIRTNLFEFLIFVRNFQSITCFMYLPVR